MSHYRRANTVGASYFFTVVTYRRQRFLCDDDVRLALRHAIQKVRANYPFTIDAWVLLPDHLHTIWTLPANDANFPLRWQLIKREVSRVCGSRLKRPEWMSASKTKHRESTLWQRRYWEHQIRDEADYARHMDYLYFNPVKHGLVSKVKDWPYSTFHRDVKVGIVRAYLVLLSVGNELPTLLGCKFIQPLLTAKKGMSFLAISSVRNKFNVPS